MCGIAGVVRFDRQGPDLHRLERMTEALAHRGPDGSGTLVRDGVGLGHRRLSIIDLALGRQPMANEDQTVYVTFNGEIYNFRELKRELAALGHRFQTDCDTEVIVHGYEQWGAECVGRFRGMFAFAVVDFRKRTMLLARDHFGIKPLYYRIERGGFSFASELSALRAAEPETPQGSLEAVELFLRYQYIPAPKTIYRDVFKLPPAHLVEVDLDHPPADGALKPRRYWDLRFAEGPRLSEGEWIERVDEALGDAVSASLVSDVPFGVFLSGGVDSTLVALKMRRELGGSVQAFSIGFDEENYSELPYAQEAVRRLGLQWHHEIVRPDALAVLPNLLRHYGEPYGDSSAIPTWYVCQLARRHVPMVLSGDGGDEVFGGYGSYKAWIESIEPETARRASRPLWKRGMLKALAAAGYQHDRPLGFSLDAWQRCICYVDAPWRRQLWRKELGVGVDSPCEAFEAAAGAAPRTDPLSFVQYLDIQTYLPCDILTKVDVAAMYHALEVRPSLLDVRLAELAASMPMSMRMRRNGSPDYTAKYALKSALELHFPHDFVHRPKQGFAIPRDRWFLPGEPARKYLESIVRDPQSPLASLFDPKGAEALMQAHAPNRDLSGPLWLLLVLGIWMEQNREVRFA